MCTSKASFNSLHLRYDGSAATDVPWYPGRPQGNLAYDLVWLDSNCTVKDDDGSDMELIVCRAPATYTVYDRSVKFL